MALFQPQIGEIATKTNYAPTTVANNALGEYIELAAGTIGEIDRRMEERKLLGSEEDELPTYIEFEPETSTRVS